MELVSATRTLTYYPRTTVYQGTQTGIIRGKSSLFPLNTVDSAPFSLRGTIPCVITGYNPDQKTIPNITAVPVQLHKYTIGGSADVLDFAFNYVPDGPVYTMSNCFFHKTYEIEVRKKTDNSAVPNAGTTAAIGAPLVNTFVTLVTPISQTAPQMKVLTTDTALEGKYIIKVKSYLITESSFKPEFEFELYLHPHPCLKTSLNGAGSPATIGALAYQINIQPTIGSTTFAKFISTVNNAAAAQSCTPLKYTIESTNADALALL